MMSDARDDDEFVDFLFTIRIEPEATGRASFRARWRYFMRISDFCERFVRRVPPPSAHAKACEAPSARYS